MTTIRFAMLVTIAAAPLQTSSLRAQTPAIDAAKFVKIERGELPIVLSAPHGGREKIPDVAPRQNKEAYRFTTGRDVGTDKLTDAVADELQRLLGKRPFLVRALFHRRYIDANRGPADAFESDRAKAIYNLYHKAIADSCVDVQKKWGRGLLLDIHGQVSRVDTVIRGTNDGKTDKLLRQRYGERAHFGPESLMGRLAEEGLKVYPTRPDEKEISGFRGGYIVQTYGSHDRFGIDAVQLEFGSNYRKSDAVQTVAAQVAQAIARFARQFLPVEEPSMNRISNRGTINAK